MTDKKPSWLQDYYEVGLKKKIWLTQILEKAFFHPIYWSFKKNYSQTAYTWENSWGMMV